MRNNINNDSMKQYKIIMIVYFRLGVWDGRGIVQGHLDFKSWLPIVESFLLFLLLQVHVD